MPVAVKDKRALILNLRNTRRVTDVITRHQLIDDPRGNVAVPHKTDAIILLRNLGINIEGFEPIKTHYEYGRVQGQYSPMPHQYVQSEFMSVNKKAFILSQQRTGKSASMIWAADFLMTEKQIDCVLVISTLSTVRKVWRDELFGIAPQRSCAILTDDKAKRLKKLSEPYDWYVMNHDGVKVIGPEVQAKIKSGCRMLIIVDEGGEFADHMTAKYKALKGICDAAEWVWWATGTPVSRGLDKAWGQVRIINPSNVPDMYTEWRSQVMFPVDRSVKKADKLGKLRSIRILKWLPRDGATKYVHEAMQPAIRFEKRDVLKDLPPITHQHLEVEQTTEQKKLLSQLRREGAALLDSGEVITAANAAVRLGKMMQCLAGSAYADSGPVLVDCTPRMDVLLELIEATEQKVVVFATYIPVVEMLYNRLRKDYGTVMVNGSVTGLARDRALNAFTSNPDIKILVAHPKVVAHGLEFSVADTTVWWCPHASPGDVAQANERMASAAQKNPMGIYYLSGNHIEQVAYDTVRGGLNLEAATLRLFREFISTE